MPTALARFRRAHPAVRLELTAAHSVSQTAAIEAGQLDAGFIYRQGALQAGLVRRPVREDRLLAALPRGHRLAARRAPLGAPDLADEPFVWFPRAVAPAYFDRAMAAFAAAGLVPRVVQEGESDSVMLSLVSAGVGVSLVNSVARWRRPDGVVLRELAGLDLALPLDFVWRAPPAPALQQLLALL